MPDEQRGLAAEKTYRLACERREQRPRPASELYAPVALELRYRCRSCGNLVQSFTSCACSPSCSVSREREDRLPKGAGGQKVPIAHFGSRICQPRRREPPGQIGGARQELARRGGQPRLQRGSKIQNVGPAAKAKAISIFGECSSHLLTNLTGFAQSDNIGP